MVGFTSTVTTPFSSAVRAATSVQVSPCFRCRTASVRPRATPVSLPRPPKVTGCSGAVSDRTPTLNQVDRSPSRRRRSAPGTTSVLSVPTTLSTLIRPDEFSSGCRSTTRPFIFSTLASFAPVKTSGPQSWCGEIESYGSATEMRYGTGSPQTSSADAVRPPDVEKKYVFATSPSYNTTWPAVSLTAAFVDGFSCSIPRYTWLRVSG